MKYDINSKGLDKLASMVIKDSGEALMKCWEYLEWKIRDEIKIDSYDTSKLADSINTKKVSDTKVIVGTNLKYALVREYGRKPWKFPPLQALVWWTARKGMISWWATAKYEDLHYTDRWVIYVIARAIATRWITGKHTFERVIDRERENIINLYVKYMNEW